MLQKKICMLGAFGVGKTSLVAQYVHSSFSDKYHATMGVKVDKKIAATDRGEVMLVLWDMAGEDDVLKVRVSYLRGAAGYVLVCDGTRASTVDVALDVRRRVEETAGPLPHVVLLNKSDLASEWELDDGSAKRLASPLARIFETSAKTGSGVEESFTHLARQFAK